MQQNRMGCGGCGTILFIILVIVLFINALMKDNSGSSRSSYSYQSTQERYDAKYGAGEYQKDREMLDSIQDRYDDWTKKK